ncbi:MAG: transposase family protein [Deltaproteobacteria bacterium]|nr:transposase family protein [Deltaproteobacteria bacterium]
MDPVTMQIMKPVLNPLFPDFERIYQIEFPLFIDSMTFDDELARVDISISYHRRALFTCACGQEGLKVHSKLERVWRALDIARYQCHLHLAVPRLRCPRCGVKIFPVPWARDHSHLTALLEDNILELASYMPHSAVARYFGETDHRILHVLEVMGQPQTLRHPARPRAAGPFPARRPLRLAGRPSAETSEDAGLDLAGADPLSDGAGPVPGGAGPLPGGGTGTFGALLGPDFVVPGQEAPAVPLRKRMRGAGPGGTGRPGGEVGAGRTCDAIGADAVRQGPAPAVPGPEASAGPPRKRLRGAGPGCAGRSGDAVGDDDVRPGPDAVPAATGPEAPVGPPRKRLRGAGPGGAGPMGGAVGAGAVRQGPDTVPAATGPEAPAGSTRRLRGGAGFTGGAIGTDAVLPGPDTVPAVPGPEASVGSPRRRRGGSGGGGAVATDAVRPGPDTVPSASGPEAPVGSPRKRRSCVGPGNAGDTGGADAVRPDPGPVAPEPQALTGTPRKRRSGTGPGGTSHTGGVIGVDAARPGPDHDVPDPDAPSDPPRKRRRAG